MAHDSLLEEWQKLRQQFLNVYGNISFSIEGVLLTVGLQEILNIKETYTKEEKRDLMHVGMCHVLEQSGYYTRTYVDEDGWPHYDEKKPLPPMSLMEQESFLKDHIILYFKQNCLMNQ